MKTFLKSIFRLWLNICSCVRHFVSNIHGSHLEFWSYSRNHGSHLEFWSYAWLPSLLFILPVLDLLQEMVWVEICNVILFLPEQINLIYDGFNNNNKNVFQCFTSTEGSKYPNVYQVCPLPNQHIFMIKGVV